jgi:hypothetical protein
MNVSLFGASGVMQPLHGIKSKTRSYRLFYGAMGPALQLLRAVLPYHATSTEQLGRAMLGFAKHGRDKAVLESRGLNAIGAKLARYNPKDENSDHVLMCRSPSFNVDGLLSDRGMILMPPVIRNDRKLCLHF